MTPTEFIFTMVFSDRYLSPKQEESTYKNIPMKYRNSQTMVDFIQKHNYRVRYRGPRRKAWNSNGRLTVTTLGQQDCLKADALYFSLYKA
jgi:hypothetical protein